jgi:hypothetical protein
MQQKTVYNLIWVLKHYNTTTPSHPELIHIFMLPFISVRQLEL